ncbi:MAG: SPFH domain-containing protein [Clostridiales Family XIII bacterium]|jgi:membrane protease subunit (stomatin/prohibitin family)|nr:SPFH domain-containing protein [Clostridiales Family XIII bacterium]
MGLIKAFFGAAGGTLADTWKDFFAADALAADVLLTKGQKYTGGRGSNTKGSDNIITAGSGIVVADGQAMAIVVNGKVTEFAAEPGEYTFNDGEPSIFGGEGFKKGFVDMFMAGVERFTYGGGVSADQRVYYFNTKELIGNKYGTSNPVPFRVVDTNIGLDIDISIRCNGEYSYKITNPILFYTNVAGNIQGDYKREAIDSQLKTELLTALQPAFAKISALGIRYSALPGHTTEIADALNEVLSAKWRDLRGLEIVSFGVNSVTASKEDEDMIKELQKTAVYRNPNMAGAALVGAQADAMKAAASNEGGAMMGFMGLGMAQQAGGAQAQQFFAQGQQAPAAPAPAPVPAPAAPAAAADGWTCAACGHAGNTSKFCEECGAPRPAGAPVYKCDKCGWVPEDPKNLPKFCPECGDVFDGNDAK